MGAEEKRNVDFEEYYTTQGIVPEGEWDQFMDCLRRPLPVTFRINGSGRHADHVRDKLQSDFFSHFSDFDSEGMSGVSIQAFGLSQDRKQDTYRVNIHCPLVQFLLPTHTVQITLQHHLFAWIALHHLCSDQTFTSAAHV